MQCIIQFLLLWEPTGVINLEYTNEISYIITDIDVVRFVHF